MLKRAASLPEMDQLALRPAAKVAEGWTSTAVKPSCTSMLAGTDRTGAALAGSVALALPLVPVVLPVPVLPPPQAPVMATRNIAAPTSERLVNVDPAVARQELPRSL